MACRTNGLSHQFQGLKMVVNSQSLCPIPADSNEICVATSESAVRRSSFGAIFSSVVAALLALVVATKLSAAIADVWYFGMVAYPVLELIQAAVLCVVMWMCLTRPSSTEALFAGSVLFAALGLAAVLKWFGGYSDCGCVPGLRISPGVIASLDFGAAAVFLILALKSEEFAGILGKAVRVLASSVPNAMLILAFFAVLSVLSTTVFGMQTTFTKNLRIPTGELSATKLGPSKEWVTVELPIHNKGGPSVQILGTKPTCGIKCLSRLPIEIPSGETRKVVLSFRFPPDSTNAVVWVTLFTSDTESLQKSLSFVARR
jgi:hypothetical protein